MDIWQKKIERANARARAQYGASFGVKEHPCEFRNQCLHMCVNQFSVLGDKLY